MLSLPLWYSVILTLIPLVLSHPTRGCHSSKKAHDSVSTIQPPLTWFPLPHRGSWNPFQCTVTTTTVQTVTEEVTSTIFVFVESTTTETVIIPVETGIGCIYASPDSGVMQSMPHSEAPNFSMSMAGKFWALPQVTMSTSTTDGEIKTMPSHMDGHCTGTGHTSEIPHHKSGHQMVSIWAVDQKTIRKPTSVMGPWKESSVTSVPSVPSTPHKPGNGEDMLNLESGRDHMKPKCMGKQLSTFTATFDDLNVPRIPKLYRGLEFSSHFSIFEPSLIYNTYVAPSPPYAAISYPSNNSTITSSMPFNLVSMYIGCGYAQNCLIRIRGWASGQMQPSVEMQVKAMHGKENWAFVKFSEFGFNDLTMLDFDVLDLKTGMKGTLGLTLDEIMITRNIYEVRDCFD